MTNLEAMKKYILKSTFGLFLLFIILNSKVFAQQGFGISSPNPDAVIDLFSINKGLLLPRILLSSTGSPSPLSQHVTGMTVYNMATIGDVTPGFYYNNGSKWLRTDTKAIGNWNLENTNTVATTVNQDIYQMGKVGIGTKTPANSLHVFSTGDPIRVEGLKVVQDVLSSNVIFVNPADGIWKTSTVNLPLGYVKKSAVSQLFGAANFNNSPVPAVITFTAADETVVDNGFVNSTGTMFTVTATGVYDIYAIINLIADDNNATTDLDPVSNGETNYTLRTLPFLSVNLKLQKSSDGGATWGDVVSTVSLSDVTGAQRNVTTTLNPIVAVVSLNANDNLRLVVQRQAGAYTTTAGNGGSGNDGIRTSGMGNGVTNSKIFKIIKLK